MAATIERARAQLSARAGQVDALSPLAVLGRGFAVPRTEDGTIVRDASVLSPGDELRLRFAQGTARASVVEVEPDAEADARESVPARDGEEES